MLGASGPSRCGHTAHWGVLWCSPLAESAPVVLDRDIRLPPLLWGSPVEPGV
jgi:hypothetical protein